ncbi:MAG: dienelactone hydrolase family protein [Phycisphaerales bacterium]|nr:dienelactone hydrolase family protein [Phycisphaerales bacterium]
MNQIKWLIRLGLLCVVGLLASGCIVGQPPGKGQVMHLTEPTTHGKYFLYLPEGYEEENSATSSKRWPVVVTFHGMRPFDDYGSQIREWQQEADRYGYVVIAPKTLTSDLLRQIAKIRPTKINAAIRRDEEVTLAALDDVSRRVNIDPTKVLSTSWSSGGYLAHYMINHHPERFTCIAPRQSNFSSEILDENQVPKYRDTKVGIFYTENDFAICRRESQEAAKWYAHNGFDVTFAVFRDLGHERRPSVAADFFARQIGATAKTPPTELARMQVTRVPLPKLNGKLNGQTKKESRVVSVTQLTGEQREAQRAKESRKRNTRQTPRKQQRATPTPAPQVQHVQRAEPVTLNSVYDQNAKTVDMVASAQRNPKPIVSDVRASQPVAEQTPSGFDNARDDQLRIRVSSTIGIVPHHVTFSAVAPAEISDGAYFLWMDNGEPISNGMNGQKYFIAPGKHEIELLMTTADGRQHYAKKTITILERLGGKGSPQGGE